MAKKYNKKASSATSTIIPPSVAPLLGGVCFFLMVCLGSPASIKLTTIVLMIVAIGAGILHFNTLRSRVHLPFLVLTAWVLCNGLSVIYATSGKFSLSEVVKVLSAFALCIFITANERTDRSAEDVGRGTALALSIGAAIACLVSIDMLSTHIISGAVIGLLGLFTPNYANLAAVEAGVRMTSLFTNPNVFAGVAGIGTLLSLGLASTEPTENKSARTIHLATLYINALAFVLAFSMGASAMIAAAFLLYLILEKKERRASLLVLMIETFVLVLLSAALISMTSFTPWTGFRPVPLLCTVAGAAGLWTLEHFFHEKASRIPAKMVIVLLCAVLALLIIFGVAAVSLTGSATLDAGGSLRRAAYPAAGEYTFTTNSTDPVTVTIESQNRQDTMMHTSTVIYSGDAASATFTVPEDSLVLYFNFHTESGATIHSATYEGTESGSVPLGYKLLPSFIANRLQGLLANQNAIQRVVFFGDGMKLFQKSPVIGLGLGGFENGIMSVQSFFYETKYAHNHYIQALCDTGIIGLLLFVAVLATSVWALIRAMRRNPLVPALLACMLFIAGHAAVELVLSAYTYLPFAYGIFALANLIGGDMLPAIGQKLRVGALTLVAVLFIVFSFLIGRNVYARNLLDRELSFEAGIRAAEIDPFEWADYALSYVMSSMDYTDDPAMRAQADEFALRVEGIISNSAHLDLAKYYLHTGRAEKALVEVEKHLGHRASDPKAWQNVMDLLMQYDTMTDSYRAGVARIGELLQEWNEAHMGSITLDEKAAAFLEEAMQ